MPRGPLQVTRGILLLRARTKYPFRIHSARPFGGDAPFSPAHLAKAVDNYNRYQKPGNAAFPIVKSVYIPAPDIGIGHEPDQLIAKILSRTDLPNLGRPVNLHLRGADLFGELENVPAEIAKMIDDGDFDEVSAEIYPDYQTPDGKRHGPVFRRLALLGGWNARQKGLGKIPPMVYTFAETVKWGGSRRVVPQQVVAIFSESPFMDRTSAIAILQGAGIPVDGLDSTPDAFLAAIAALIQQLNPAANGGTTSPAGTPEQAMQTFAERVLFPRMSNMLAEQLRPIREESANALRRATEQECLTFGETYKAKLYPYELDPSNPAYLITRLAKMPADIRRSEMEAIKARPDVRKFGEQMPGSGGQSGSAGGNAPMTPERKAQLLGFTGAGRARLERQARSVRDTNNN